MTTAAKWLPALIALIGVEQCETQAIHRGDMAVDGLAPEVIVSPHCAEQVAAVLQWAQQQKLTVLPCGTGSKKSLGGLPRRVDIVLSTLRLNQVCDYDAANFTVTAGAGLPFADLAQLIAPQRQMLPLQYPFSRATLGGLIATNAYNPKRLLYGGVRDLLLGLRIALPSGEVAHFGGKVVKNVAGYDMCKLFLGSLGALGVIVEATFKLFALPERDDTLLAVFPALNQGAAAATQLMGTSLQPSQILLLNHNAAPMAGAQADTAAAVLLVDCEGMDEAVTRQLAEITRLCEAHGAVTVQALSADAQCQVQQRLGTLMPNFGAGTAPASVSRADPDGKGATYQEITLRLGTLPSQVHAVMPAVTRTLQAIAPGAVIIGDYGAGLVQVCLRLTGPNASETAKSLVHTIRELPELAAAHGGYAVVESAPAAVKAQLDVWGLLPSSFALVRALKQRFDPEGILNTGRFIGGL